jgi:alpha-beta hydrolase superfamily lysophospholipase
VLIAHGDADEVVPFDHALALYQAAKGPKQLVTISGGKHNDPLPEEYRIAFDKFLADLPALSTENEGIITLQPRRPPPVDIDVRVQELP